MDTEHKSLRDLDISTLFVLSEILDSMYDPCLIRDKSDIQSEFEMGRTAGRYSVLEDVRAALAMKQKERTNVRA